MAIITGLSILTAFADIPASNLSEAAEYPAYITGEANWAPIYISDNTNYVEANVKAAETNASYKAVIPSATENNIYAYIYFNAGDPTRVVTSGDTMDLGFKFTAPITGTYKLSADMNSGSYDGTANADGMKVKIFDKDFNSIDEVLVTDQVLTYQKMIELEKDEVVYIFFNKNETIYNDGIVARYMKMNLMAAPLADATFPSATAFADFPVIDGTVFHQFFNLRQNNEVQTLWKGFVVTETNTIGNLDISSDFGKYILPPQYQDGANIYANIWEGIGNAFMPADTYTIGDYFTAPVKGKINVNLKLKYETDPGDNIDAADGVYVTVYKNKISDDTMLGERTLFDFANSGAEGKTLKLENIDVNKNDIIIFVYNKNNTIYNDSVKVLEKNITYTKSEGTVKVFDPDNKNITLKDSKLLALDTLTIEQAVSALSLNKNCGFTAYDAAGNVIEDHTAKIGTVSRIAVTDKSFFIHVGEFEVSAVSSLDESTPGNNDDDNQTDNPGTSDSFGWITALALTALTSICLISFKKKHVAK